MLTNKDRTAAHKAVEDLYRLRRSNIRACLEAVGTWEQLALASGFNKNLLIMMAGPNPTRAVSEIAARRFEISLGLAVNWLDQKH